MNENESKQVGGSHYQMDVEPWDAMAAWMPEEEFVGFLRGNAIKYLARMGRKGDALEDAQKAGHYVEKLVEYMARMEAGKELLK